MHAKAPQPLNARAQAHSLLNLVIGRRLSVDEALAAEPLTGSEPDQRFAMLLLLSALQHRGQIETLLSAYLDKPLPMKRLSVIHALHLGVVQLLLLDTPPHAAVNETVALIKKGKDAGFAGLVNAVLQRLAREKPPMPDAIHNLPLWLRTRWEANYGADAVAKMATLATTRPPLDVNTRETIDSATRLDKEIVRMPSPHPAVENLPGYAEGKFFVQDVAASYPARLLGEVREHQALDIGAAPGGKTMQLIQAGAFVTAIDRAAPRMRVLKENLKRMQMQANTIVTDALEWQPRRAYDAILLDAPCTASGTWRRHPEMVHLLSEKDIAEMVSLQRALLMKAWEWLKPGGRMVYSVCSLEPEEGEQQAAWFLSQTADATTLPIPTESGIPQAAIRGHYLRTTPDLWEERGGMDGFFAVCILKDV